MASTTSTAAVKGCFLPGEARSASSPQVLFHVFQKRTSWYWLELVFMTQKFFLLPSHQ